MHSGSGLRYQERQRLGFDAPPSAYPLEPVDPIPFQRARHGFVNTTTGGLVFRMSDFRLPGRMPIEMGRVYDSKLSYSLPPSRLRGPQEPRWNHDLGDSWILNYSACLIADGPGNYIMATPEGDLVRWLDQGGSYQRADKAPSRHMKLAEPNGPCAPQLRARVFPALKSLAGRGHAVS